MRGYEGGICTSRKRVAGQVVVSLTVAMDARGSSSQDVHNVQRRK